MEYSSSLASSSTSSSNTTRQLPKRQDSTSTSSSSSYNSTHTSLILPNRPIKSTARRITLKSSKSSMNHNGKGKESDEDILRSEMEEEWNSTRRERGVEDGRFNNNNDNNNNIEEKLSISGSPTSIRYRNTSTNQGTIPIGSRGSSVSRGKRRKMTIGEDDEQVMTQQQQQQPRPISIYSIASSSDGDSIYEDARDYFEDIKEEYRKEYELGGTRPLFSLLPSPFPNSSSSRRTALSSSQSRSPPSPNDLINHNNPKRNSTSTSISSANSSPLLYTKDLPKLKTNVSRRSWTPKPLVLTPARSVAIPLTSPRSQLLNLSSSSGSNGPLSPLLSTSDLLVGRRSSITNSPISRPGSAMSYIVNSPTSDGGGTSSGTNSRRRKSIGYFESGIDTVLNSSGTSQITASNQIKNGRRNRDSNSSYGADMKRSGSDQSEERESPDSSYDVWEEGERGDSGISGGGEGVIAKISDILEVVEEVSGLWKSDEDEEEEEEEEVPPVSTPIIHLSLPSPVQTKILTPTTSSSYSHSLATLDESSTSHHPEGITSVTLEPPTPPPPFPLPVLPSKSTTVSPTQGQQQQQQPDDRYFSNYSDFLLKTRGSGTRSVQSNEVYDAYWDANSPATAAGLARADSSNYGSEDGSVRSRMLNTPAAIARRNTLNKGFPPPSPPSSDHRSDSSSARSSQYGNALEEQKVLKMEELLDGFIPAVLRVRTSQSMLRPLPPIIVSNDSLSTTTTTLVSDVYTPSPLIASKRYSPPSRRVSPPPIIESPLTDPTSFWPPLDDGKTKVISLSPRLEALSLENGITSKKSNNQLAPGERNLRHQSSLASSTGSRRWSSTPFSTILANKNSSSKRDSKLSKSTNSKMMLCIPVGSNRNSMQTGGRKQDIDLRGLEVFGLSDDEEEPNGSIMSSTGSIIRLDGVKKKFSVGSETKKFFSLSKKSKSSLRSGSPVPSNNSSTHVSNYSNSTTGLGISKDWNGRTTIIASSPPVIPTLVNLTPVDRKVETWTSVNSSSLRYLDNVLEGNESKTTTTSTTTSTNKRFSSGSSFSGRRPVPNYYLPEVLGSTQLEPSLTPSPPRLELSTNYLNRSTSSIPSPTSVAVAKVLIQRPITPSAPRVPSPTFPLPDQAPILPHIRQDSDPFNSDLKLLNLSSSSSPTSISTPSSTSTSSSYQTPTIASPLVRPFVLPQHTFPALRGSNNSPHSKSVVLPVKKIRVLEVNPTRVTFRSQR